MCCWKYIGHRMLHWPWPAFWCLTTLSTIFQLYHDGQFIGGGNRSTRIKPSTCRNSLTNLITYCYIEYTAPWTGFDLTTLVVIRSDCTGMCKSNYYTITTCWPWWVCDVLLIELVCLLLYALLLWMIKVYSLCWYVGHWLSYWPWRLFNVLTSRTGEPTNNNTLRQNRWFILSNWNYDFIWRSSKIPAASLFGI
jgi:hypothetical protein